MRTVPSLFLLCAAGAASKANGFSASSVVARTPGTKVTTIGAPATASSLPSPVLTTVAVTGATGRTGRLVVQELLNRGVPNVVAIVRNETKAKEVLLGSSTPEAATKGGALSIVSCDLTNDEEISSVLRDADAAIWCATGFADAQPPAASTSSSVPILDKVKKLLGLSKMAVDETKATTTSRQSIDLIGLPMVAKCMLEKLEGSSGNAAEEGNNEERKTTPRVVMLSSAGVTRPTWDDKKKSLLSGAADIPIVRLNPFGILDVKRRSEEALRASNVPYCIVRPAGLNDDWPAHSRPVLSQGDVAVGRIHREDVAKILVEALFSPDATGKTFEAISVAGYPGGSAALTSAMARLRLDSDEFSSSSSSSFDSVYATYSALQQLLPGEKQDSAALAMGQTYEQLDRGVTGRLGKRGEENAEAAAPKPTS